MIDSDLADLYGVATKALLQAVRRNRSRFPEDFLFELDAGEWERLRSQTVTSNAGRGGRRRPPNAFTEQGVAMLSSVLKSSAAIAVNIEIMRTFVRLRDFVAANKELARQFAALEARIDKRIADHDQAIVEILSAIRTLMKPNESAGRPIGFVTSERSNG
jgi:hypothetical protein